MRLTESLSDFPLPALWLALSIGAAAPCAAQFVYERNVSTGNDSNFLEMVDVDLDGDLDMIVPSYTAQAVRILLNDGRGMFPTTSSIPVPFGSVSPGQKVIHVAVGDLNGDSLPDIVADGQLDAWVLFADGAGSYTVTQAPTSVGGGLHELYVLDIDNDCDLDVMSARELLLNDGLGTLTPGTLPAGIDGYNQWVAFADFDVDGNVDLVAASENGSDTDIEFHAGDGSAGFAPPLIQTFNYHEPLSLEVHEFTGDGIPDLILSSVGGLQAWAILRSTGTGAFVQVTGYSISDYFVVGDFNGDGVQDVVSQDWMYYLYGHLSNGSGGFSFVYWDDLYHRYLQDAADLNGDDLADLVFSFLLNGGPGSLVTIFGNRLASRDWRQSPVNGHWYRVLPAQDWISAEHEAVARGAHLATIRSAAENDWLNAQFNETLFIGFTDADNEGQFEWVSGEPVTYSNWAVGQPDDLGDSDAGVWQPGGLWRDEPLSTILPAMVEVESDDCDGNGIPDRVEVARGWAEDINGDGSLDSCVSPYYCYSPVNSSGSQAEIALSGTPAIGVDTLHLEVTGLPQNRFGYFLMSDSQGFLPQVGGGQGSLCLGLPFVRFAGDVLNSGAAGVMSYTPDLVSPPGGVPVLMGESWNFQAWFRDMNPGATSNLSSAVSVTLSADPRPTASFTPFCTSIVEQTTQLTVLVELSWAYHNDVLIPFTVSGSATDQVDWRVETSNPLLVQAGQTTAPVLITVAGDATAEPLEVGRIELMSSPSSRPGAHPVFELRILDDD